jgi:two-component system chemotaxis response regulator CheY
MVFLIIEDSRPTRNLIKTYIEELNIGPHIILEAESAEAALSTMEIRTIDFALIDWNLSTKMNGLDVLKEMRQNDKYKKYKDIPVIMVSSESDKFNVVESLKFGANDFVAKPIDQKSFGEKVMKHIKKKK